MAGKVPWLLPASVCVQVPDKLAVVMGSEAKGVSATVRAAADRWGVGGQKRNGLLDIMWNMHLWDY
jgi:hypothetical protein